MINLIIYAVLFVLAGIVVMGIISNLVDIAYSMEDYNIYKRRANQLKKEIDRGDTSVINMIEKYTSPISEHILPRISKYLPSLSIDGQEELRKKLELIGWDDTFTPVSFVASGILLKIIGLIGIPVSFILFKGSYLYVALAVCGIAMFGLDAWVNSEAKGRSDELFSEFPDLIRIVSGYLSADMTIVDSFKESLQYVGDAWKPVVSSFVITCNTQGVSEALDHLKYSIDIFEVKEFVALVKLTIEQGGNVKDGFLEQADKVNDMKKNAMYLKIGKRKTMATLLQFPLLILNTIIIIVPTLFDMVAMF